MQVRWHIGLLAMLHVWCKHGKVVEAVYIPWLRSCWPTTMDRVAVRSDITTSSRVSPPTLESGHYWAPLLAERLHDTHNIHTPFSGIKNQRAKQTNQVQSQS